MRAATVLGEDKPSDTLRRAIDDLRAGLLTAGALASCVAELLPAIESNEAHEAEAERLYNEKGECASERDRAQWELEVALAALEDLRQRAGACSLKIEYAAERMASEARPPSRAEMNEHEEVIRLNLKALNEACAELHLREGERRDFKAVAARFDLAKKEP